MNCKTFFTWKNIIGMTLSCVLFWSTTSQAQTTFTHGIVANASTVLWFKPDISITWVDVHFNTGSGQQNVRMTLHTSGRFEQVINANSGTVVTYSFTYSINGSVAFDTAQFTVTVPDSASSSKASSSALSSLNSSSVLSSTLSSASRPTTSSSAASAGISNGVVDNASSVIIWLKPNNVTVAWVDVHFAINNGTQQNVRMTFNSSLSRYEQAVTTTTGPLSIVYSFTHQTPLGAVDTAIFNFTRGSISSRAVSSNTVSSKSSLISSRSSASSRSSVSSSSKSSVASSISINVDRSLLVHDAATLQAADFSFRSTLQQLVNQLNTANPGNQTTVEQLFARMWDTQNPTPGRLAGGEKCTGLVNGFTVECRPAEGAQADNPVFFIGNYAPIALINRLDLRDNVAFNDCGEYRIIYANQGGSRNFIIFEAQLPNPNPGVAAGCLSIAQFWQNLSAQTNASVRATSLRNFYFAGIPAANVRAVIDMRNYANATGQIRTNMFMGSSWNLKEFKVGVDAQGVSMISPVSVKSNPVAFLFDGTNTDARASVFQSDFIANMASLLSDFNSFSLTVAKDAHNNGQSHASFSIDENQFTPAFLNANANAFQEAVENKLTASGSNLTATQLMNRATAMTCGGCHEPSSFGINAANAIGPNQAWPNTLGFVHISEFANAGVFPLSPALTDVFLPVRLAGFNSYLANTNAASAQPGVASATLKTSAAPVSDSTTSANASSTQSQPRKFNKRAG